MAACAARRFFSVDETIFVPSETTVPAFAGTVDLVSKAYFFLAAFFLDAFFFAFFAFAAMLKLHSRVSPGTEYIHDELIYKQYMTLRDRNVVAM
jgi:hypothetical protein